MADIRKLYIDFISDLDPFTDITEHENMSIKSMLYNLNEIKKNWNFEPSDPLYNRINTLIDLFTILKWWRYWTMKVKSFIKALNNAKKVNPNILHAIELYETWLITFDDCLYEIHMEYHSNRLNRIED